MTTLTKIEKKLHAMAFPTAKKKHNLTIEPTFVPRGSGNNPMGGKRDLHYKIREWGYIFPTKAGAEKYANEHEVGSEGFMVKRKK